MESVVVMSASFWSGKRVLVTGHTGFKGSWLSLWLQQFGADVTGYALEPPSRPNLFTLAGVGDGMVSMNGDIRDGESLLKAVRICRPEIIFHLAAQSLVRKSYQDPVGTFGSNVMGTVNLLEAVRKSDCVRAVVNVTSDKCYENREWFWGYRENDALGGMDPYSCSKSCAELATAAYRKSFFDRRGQGVGRVFVATVRAGNVIGGGDWAEDRLIPDLMRAVMSGKPVLIRNPHAVRPWQHVLEPLEGYLTLAEKLWEGKDEYADAWNFGPDEENTVTVEALALRIKERWGHEVQWLFDPAEHPHESRFLKLDSSKARSKLMWRPRLTLSQTVDWLVEWYQCYQQKQDMKKVTLSQLESYQHINR